MTDNLVTRLRDKWVHSEELCYEAADEIERLLANAKQDAGYLAAYHRWCAMNGCAPSSSDLIAARAALGEDK